MYVNGNRLENTITEGDEGVKRKLCIALIMINVLTGCTKGDKPAIMDDNMSPDMTSIQIENKKLYDQVTQLQLQLKATEQKYKDLQNAIDSTRAAEPPLMTRFPKLSDFLSAQDFQKIVIKDAKGSKIITDPAILKSVSHLIAIKDQASLGSGPLADIEPVQYILTTAKGAVKVNVEQLGIVSFQDLYPGQYFEVDNTVYQLGKAFMNRPSYLNQEPAIVKMVNSGLVKVSEKNGNDLYMYLGGRIHSIVMAFNNAEKHESIKPKDTSASNLNITFYYYGEEIQMNLYTGKIQIKDSTSEKWFDMKDEDIGQIKAVISAS